MLILSFPVCRYSSWLVKLFFGAITLQSCSQHQAEIKDAKRDEVQFEAIEICAEGVAMYETSMCQSNAHLLTSTNNLVVLQADTSIVFVDSNTGSKTLILSNEQKMEVQSFGDILGLFAVNSDSVVLLCARGFVLLNSESVLRMVRLNQFTMENYFFTAPWITDKSIAFISPKLYFLVGGEWSYPFKKYPSEMRFIFEFDLSSDEGRVLNFVNPDFGNEYEVMSKCNLSSVNGKLFVNYSADTALYMCDFESEELKKIDMAPILWTINPSVDGDTLLAKSTKSYSIKYSDYVAMDERSFARVGVARRSAASSADPYAKEFQLIFELFDQDAALIDRIYSDHSVDNQSTPFAIGQQLSVSRKCNSEGSNKNCFCYQEITLKE